MTERAPKYVEYVEIDLPYCSLTYGEGACTAVLGVDSEDRCFNTFATCPVRDVFDETTVTLRFGKDSAYLNEAGIDCIPVIETVNYDPAVISLGEKSLGIRAKMSVRLRDERHADTGEGFDKYFALRDYDPYAQGTLWGKFRARHPILVGRPIRYIQGIVGQSLEEMETRHLIVDSLQGPSDGSFSIIAKDILQMLDGKRALAPAPSSGFLVADITASATSATLGPAGIGNAEYPASGYAAIGGSEIVAFTRSGNTLTITRGQFNTQGQTHSAQDRVQLCLYYQGEDPADICADLIENYAGVDASWIPLGDWQDETAAKLRRVYTALIPEPTPVRDLVSELCEQAALSFIPDDILKRIRMQVLSGIPTQAQAWNDTNIGAGTLRIKEQPDKRFTNVVTYFALKNPLASLDDPTNYRSVASLDQTDFDVESQPRIKRIYSRWIPLGGRTIADRLNAIQAGRYFSAPHRFDFEVFRDRNPQLGVGYRVEDGPSMQLPSGAMESVPFQITALKRKPGWFVIEGEEVRFINLDEEDLDNRIVIIEGNDNNLNARNLHDALYPPLEAGNIVTFIVMNGVTISSVSTGLYAFEMGSWPGFIVPQLIIHGNIRAPGGRGGNGRLFANGNNGQPGGGAFRTTSPCAIELNGTLWSGGGGGGGGGSQEQVAAGGGGGGGGTSGGGGGSAASWNGISGQNGASGTSTSGGARGLGRWLSSGQSLTETARGGNGGGPGVNGANGLGYTGRLGGTGGLRGAAIDGDSLVTLTGSGDLRGSRIN